MIALSPAQASGQALDMVELVARVVHVAAAALWIGMTWWDAWVLGPDRDGGRAGGLAPDASSRLRGLGAPWLRWSSLLAVGLGVVLLFLVYYSSRTAYLTGAMPEAGSWMTALLVILAGAGVQEAVQRAAPKGAILAAGALALAATWVFESHLGFTPRGTYVHTAAFLAALQATSVWSVIAPAYERGEPGDSAGIQGRIHANATLAIATLALMVGIDQAGLFGHPPLTTVAAILAAAWIAATGLSALARTARAD